MDVTKAMQAFVEVAGAGSFVAAAEKLDTSTAAISRQISALERHFGARLIQRTTRRSMLTESGRELLARVQQILADIAETEAVVGQHALKPSGLLRISAPLSFGMRELARVLPDFCRRYPDIRLGVDLTDRLVDLVDDGVDVAIRIARTPSANLIVRKIAPVDMIVCAAPAYLKQYGTPQRPEDLNGHKTLGYSYLSSGDSWVFQDGSGRQVPVHIHPQIHANNGDVLCAMAKAGFGIAIQPDFLVRDDLATGALCPLLAGWSIGEFHLYAVYLSRKYLSPKVRVFIDFLVEVLGRKVRDRP